MKLYIRNHISILASLYTMAAIIDNGCCPCTCLVQILRTFWTKNMTISSSVDQHKNLPSFWPLWVDKLTISWVILHFVKGFELEQFLNLNWPFCKKKTNDSKDEIFLYYLQGDPLVTFLDLKTTHFFIRQIFGTPCISVSPKSGL